MEGDLLTLQCNLTSVHGVPQESFWMKNGEEILETRSSNRNAEYRSVPVRVRVGSLPAHVTPSLVCRLSKPKGEHAGVYVCVFTFQDAPPANVSIEVRCRCRFVGLEATVEMKTAVAALSCMGSVKRGAANAGACAGCSAAAGALDTFLSPTASSAAADGGLFV